MRSAPARTSSAIRARWPPKPPAARASVLHERIGQDVYQTRKLTDTFNEPAGAEAAPAPRAEALYCLADVVQQLADL